MKGSSFSGQIVVFILVIVSATLVWYTSETVNNFVDENRELKQENSRLKQQLKSPQVVEVEIPSNCENKELEIIALDLDESYPHLTQDQKEQIYMGIVEASNLYNIHPMILYSLLHVESSMRFWIEHPTSTIEINGKKVKAQAVGLGGVMWEWWSDLLKEKNIAQKRSELFLIQTNIMASATIYNELYMRPMHPKAHNKDESAMIRYFGGGYRSYFEKIDTHIAKLYKKSLYRKE